MTGKLNGAVKQWWPIAVAAVLAAAAWGTLRADVTHNREQIVGLENCTEEIGRSLVAIERAVAHIEGMMQARESLNGKANR